MKLNCEQIKNITHGAVAVSAENGVYSFDRFSTEQLGIYEEKYRVYYERAQATTSVIFEFDTDSSHLGFGYSIEKVRDEGVTGFDVFLNGESYAELRHSPEGVKDAQLSLRLPEGCNRVTLFFPSHYKMTVRDVSIDEGAVLLPVSRGKRILFLGDSITQGACSVIPSVTLPSLLARKYPIEVLNQGIGSMHMFSPCIDSGTDFNPDIVIIPLGTNDWNSDPTVEKCMSDCRAYLERARELYPKATRVYVSPLWRSDRDTDTKCCSFDECKAGFMRIAKECGCLTIDGEMLIPHDAELLADVAHPKTEGFFHYAERLDAALRELGIEL